MKTFVSQPNIDFDPSNNAGRELFDKHHGSCNDHRPSTRSSYELSTLLTSITPSSNTVANISRENNNNYENIIPTVSSIPNPIPTFTNNVSLDSKDSKGKNTHSTSQVLITSSPATTKFENDTYPANDYFELHKQVSSCSTFNTRHNTSFRNNNIGIYFLSTLSPSVASKNIIFIPFHAAVFNFFI